MDDTSDVKDYREFILGYYENKKRTNPRYSMRAYARDLNLSPSTLNEIINRHHTLSVRSSEKVLLKIKLNDAETEKFRKLVAEELFRRKVSHYTSASVEQLIIKIDPSTLESLKKEIQDFISMLLSKYHSKNGREELVVTALVHEAFLESASLYGLASKG